MTRSEIRQILLIASCPTCRAAVAAALGGGASTCWEEPSFVVHALPAESLLPEGCSDSGPIGHSPDALLSADAILIDWPKSAGQQMLARLLLQVDAAALPTLVVLAEDVEAAVATVAQRLPGDRSMVVPRSLASALLRQVTGSACESSRLRALLATRMEKESQLQRRAEEVERRSEELERWKKEFLANVSHELRTPMNAILGYSRLLLREQLPQQHQRQIEEIHGAGNSLLDLINNIIDFTKLSGGEIRLANMPFRVRDVATELVEHYRKAAEQKGLRLECHVPSDVPVFLRGDKHRYRQVLAGLLSNAVKFTERGAIDIRITADETVDDKVTLRTVVTDTGIGIASDRQEAVFREFSQGDGSTTRSFGGLGLGLAVAKRLGDLMGGQIGFRSVLGDGTSFWLTLPFRLSSESGRETVEEPADQFLSSADSPPEGSRRRRILAVDGDATQRVLIEAFLSRTGSLVDAVPSVDDAVAAASGLNYDLAFVEIADSSADGTEAIRRLRGVLQQRGLHTPIVAVGHGLTSADRQAVVDAGAADWLAKPLDVPDLIETVRRYLPSAIDALLLAEVAIEGAAESCKSEDETSWSDQLDEMKRAVAEADFTRLEVCTGALRQSALKRGSRAAADGAIRLQLAVRSRDSKRISMAMERLDEIIDASRDTDTTRRTQFQTC